MRFAGAAHAMGDHIDTDVIIPSVYIARSEPEYLGAHAFARVDPGFVGRVVAGDIIVAGENFGCGSSREHAPIAIKAAGIACVVATSFSRIFYRSAINIGLPAIGCAEAHRLVQAGDRVEVDLEAATLTCRGRVVPVDRFSPEVLSLLAEGGLIPFMGRRYRQMKAEAAAL